MKHRFEFLHLTEDDLPMLFKWLNRPHLIKWWGREVSLDQVREKYLSRIEDKEAAKPFIVKMNDKPIGYIQYYNAGEGNPDWWSDKPGTDVLGIDQFIADEENLNKGIGTSMISGFIKLLFEDKHVTEIRVDPRPDNLRAIRCYEKVGFQKIKTIITPDGLALMMVLKRNKIQFC